MKLNCNALRLAAFTTLSACGLASAQIAEQLPSNTLVAVKINHLKQTSDKVAKLANDLGVAAFAPEMADPLAAVEQKLHIKGGVDDSGELGFAFLDPAAFGNNPDKSSVVLVPVTNYDTFISSFEGAKTEGGVTEFTPPDAPEPQFVMKWGKYAAVSPNKDVLTSQTPKGLKIAPKAMKEMDSKDAALYANFVALRAKLQPELQQQRGQWIATLEDAMKNSPQTAKYTPIFKAVADQGLNIADRFLSDTDAATVSLNIGPEGISSTVMAEFTADSYLGKTASTFKNTDKPLLEGLPDGKYIVYGGSAIDPAVLGKLVSDTVDPVSKEIAANPELKPVTDYIETFKGFLAAQKSSTFGMLAPTGAIGVEPLFQIFAVYTGDSKTLLSAFGKMADSQQQMMQSINAPGMNAVKTTHVPAAKTLDGVTFDQIITKVDPNAQDPQAVQQAQIMAMMYGPNGATVNVGAIDDKVLMATGVQDPQLSAAIAAVKKGDAPVAAPDKVKAVAAQLPKQRLGVFYVGVDDIVTTAMSYARQFGAGLNVQLPPDLPPIGTTISTDGPAIKIDSYVPTSLVQSLVAAGMQAKMQMGGGAPQGGGM